MRSIRASRGARVISSPARFCAFMTLLARLRLALTGPGPGGTETSGLQWTGRTARVLSEDFAVYLQLSVSSGLQAWLVDEGRGLVLPLNYQLVEQSILSSRCGSVAGDWAETGSDSGCYWLWGMSGLVRPHGQRSRGRELGRGVDSSCWFTPGVLRRLFELPEPVLSRHQLKCLEEHRYSSSGRSLLEPSMQRYWEWLVHRMPPWIAPNLITIVGLATNIFTTLVLVYYCPTATEQAPLWAYLLCAVGLFVYQSLDAIDGKQARRTSSSSPLGELFDHGCDSLSTVFVVLGTSIAVQLGTHPDWMFFCCFSGMFMFYCAHWQTIDVTEVQIFIILMYLLAAVGGSAFWQSPGTSVLSPVLHIGSVIVLAMMIHKKSAVQLFEKHPCLYVLAFGFVSAKITNKLVVAHMTKSEMHLYDVAFLGPGLLFLDQYFNSFIDEYLVLWISLILSLLDLVRYCFSVCNEIAAHLHICVFKIKLQSSEAVE
ncbi:Choline/ethanolaminephosphotransferase 1 [Triplophysa tibetana]|uniref:Choline/ethanolaminephosphotransferase 1 n=1 Tax=Triplophysa tibetana TaxID=1572043 RepID=A0A5A9NQP9_9TELE|nr:Choline/ethanolaminephosphotransferase 1 [Triplophysa tibetana]